MRKDLAREHRTLEKMIIIFCRAHHHLPEGQLCLECQSLAYYAHQRIAACPFGLHKPTCANCTVHCYKPDQSEQIRQVMRFAGPRMLFHHPVLAAFHLVDRFRKPPVREKQPR